MRHRSQGIRLFRKRRNEGFTQVGLHVGVMFCLQLTDEVLPCDGTDGMRCDAGAGFAVCRSNCERQAQPHLILTFSSFMTTANSHLATHSIQHPNPLPLHLERRPSQGPAQARRRTDSRAYPPSTSLLPRHTKGATVYRTVNSTAPLTSLRLLARFPPALPCLKSKQSPPP